MKRIKKLSRNYCRCPQCEGYPTSPAEDQVVIELVDTLMHIKATVDAVDTATFIMLREKSHHET